MFSCPVALAMGWPGPQGPRCQDIRHRNQTVWLIQTLSWDWYLVSTASCWPKQVTGQPRSRRWETDFPLYGKSGNFFADGVGVGREACGCFCKPSITGTQRVAPRRSLCLGERVQRGEDRRREALLAFSSRLHLSLAPLGRGLKSCHLRP